MTATTNDFIAALTAIMESVYQTACDHGWYEGEVNRGEKIALMHSELSEALEAFRHNDPSSDKIPEFTNSEEELADVIIRILDFARHFDLRIPEAVVAKMAYNESRPYKHGGKAF